MNRGWRFCRPLPYHLATAPVGSLTVRGIRAGPRTRDNSVSGGRWRDACLLTTTLTRTLRQTEGRQRRRPCKMLERETGFEPATSTLARSHSTTELFPLTGRSRPHSIAPAQTTVRKRQCVPQRRRGNQRSSPRCTTSRTPIRYTGRASGTGRRSRPPPPRRTGTAGRSAVPRQVVHRHRHQPALLPGVTASAAVAELARSPAPSPRRTPSSRRPAPRCRFRHAASGSGAQESTYPRRSSSATAEIFPGFSERLRNGHAASS